MHTATWGKGTRADVSGTLNIPESGSQQSQRACASPVICNLAVCHSPSMSPSHSPRLPPCPMTSRLTRMDGPLASGSVDVTGAPTKACWLGGERTIYPFAPSPPGQLWTSMQVAVSCSDPSPQLPSGRVTPGPCPCSPGCSPLWPAPADRRAPCCLPELGLLPCK